MGYFWGWGRVQKLFWDLYFCSIMEFRCFRIFFYRQTDRPTDRPTHLGIEAPIPELKNDPKIESKSNVRIERDKENESCSTTWVDPKLVVEPYPNPKNSPLGPQKVKNDPKTKSKSNVRIERDKENESCSTTSVDPKIGWKHSIYWHLATTDVIYVNIL